MSTSLVILTKNNFTLSMTCIPNENNLNYLWERKTALLPSRAQGIHSSRMSITNLMPEDSGEYRCVLSNTTGTISSDYFKLTIEGITIYNLFTYRKVGLLSACACNFRRKLFVKVILSVRRICLINNCGECNTESPRCESS